MWLREDVYSCGCVCLLGTLNFGGNMPGQKMLGWPDLCDKNVFLPGTVVCWDSAPHPSCPGHPLCKWLPIFMLILTTGLATCI